MALQLHLQLNCNGFGLLTRVEPLLPAPPYNILLGIGFADDAARKVRFEDILVIMQSCSRLRGQNYGLSHNFYAHVAHVQQQRPELSVQIPHNVGSIM